MNSFAVDIGGWVIMATDETEAREIAEENGGTVVIGTSQGWAAI